MVSTMQQPRQASVAGFTENEILASICRDSFYYFLREFWDTVVPEKPVYNWHIEYLCDELQMVAEDVFLGLPKEYDLVANMPPGTTKSIVSSIMFPAWAWTRMPSARFICGSYAYALSTDLSRKCRDVVKSDKYRTLFPYIVLRDDQDSKEHFINTKGGERYAFGVGGSVFGKHAHIIIVDDPLDPQEALSAADLKTANHWMNEVLPSRKVDKAVTPTILIMQRLHQMDPTGDRMEKAAKLPAKLICLPAELTENVHPAELAAYYVDGLMDPVRLSRQVLTEAAVQLGEYGYAGQFLQNPVPRGGGLFHVKMLKVGEPPLHFKSIVRYWDKAATQGGGAYSVGAKIAEDMEHRYWVLNIIRGQWDSFRREKKIVETVRLDGPEVRTIIEQEGGGGGKESAENTVRVVARETGRLVQIHKVNAGDGDKEKRAIPFSIQVNAGNVWLAEDYWNAAYIDEMRYFPKSRYKDQMDASSGGYNAINRKIVVGGMR